MGEEGRESPNNHQISIDIDGDDIRRCSIGSASSLIGDNNNNQNNNLGPGGGGEDPNRLGVQHQLSVPGGGGGGTGCARQLSIRRVSDISHINELRRSVLVSKMHVFMLLLLYFTA